MLSVLSQLRAGYLSRPSPCPWSVILCGMRDVRDYKVASGGQPVRLGSATPFNIKAASIRMGNFTADEVRELYLQHTADTGQVFADDAMKITWTLTEGQPWLVNALAREVVEVMKVPVNETITVDHIEKAKDRLIMVTDQPQASRSTLRAGPGLRPTIPREVIVCRRRCRGGRLSRLSTIAAQNGMKMCVELRRMSGMPRCRSLWLVQAICSTRTLELRVQCRNEFAHRAR